MALVAACAVLVGAGWLLPIAAADAAADCDLGVVGAAAGGIYTAWRAAEAGRSVCIFERNGRIGGRIHSLRHQGPTSDLVVEAGGYRFAPKPIIKGFGPGGGRIDTPLTAKIIRELKLPTAPYNPNVSQWDHGMYKIVTPEGYDAGYLTFIERMLELAVAKGAKIRLSSPVVGLRGVAGVGDAGHKVGAVVLKLQSGEEVTVRSVLLNIPQRPIIELLRNSGGEIASIFPKPLYNPVTYPLVKLYIHYDDAWWRNDLGLVAGTFITKEAPPPYDPGTWVPTEDPAPLMGQYHDGDVRCDLPGGRCRGFLQAFYGGDDTDVAFYAPFVDAVADDPAVMVRPDAQHHRALLEAVHASLVNYHRDALLASHGGGAAGQAALRRVEAMRPSGAVLTIWDKGVGGIQAGCHTPKRRASGEDPIPGALAKAALRPLPGWPVYVANEAYGTMHCFAEGSLAMAEAALHLMGVSLPPGGWLEEDFAKTLLEPEASMGRPNKDPFFLVRDDADVPNLVV